MIKIYDINDNVLMQAEVTSAAKREQEMSKSDYISLSFFAAEKIILPAGAYINYTYKIDKVREVTRKFLLLESYEPTQSDECSWKYAPQFQHPKMILSKTPFFIYTRNSQNIEIKQNVWSFVGTTSVISGKIADFLNKDLMFGECGWKVIFQKVTTNTINVSFSDNDFISALTAITNAIGNNCEWHIDYDDEIIYIGKVLVGATPVVLEVGKNVGVPSINNNKEGYYNAFSIFGGTRNITQVNSKGENVSSGDIRLQLDEGNGTISIDGKERSYSIDKYSTLDLRADKTKEPLFTKVLDFSQIYPSLNTYVYNVRGRVKYVLDENNEKIPISYNTDDSVKEYKTFTVWYMRLAYPTTEKVEGKTIINTTIDDGITHYWYDFEVTDNLLINGKNIGCSFEANFNTGALSTPLAGRGTNGDYVGFELIYHKEASSSHTSDDVSKDNFSVLAGDYEIIYQEDNEVIIPTNEAEMLIPRGDSKPSLKCNITVLYNIAMADTIYYEDARDRLLEKAKEEIVRLLSDLNNYEVKSYSDVFLMDNPQLQIGQSVTYKDGHGYELATRVLKLSTNIDYDFIQEITVGNQAIKGTITQLKEDVQSIIANGGNANTQGNYTVSQLNNIIAQYGGKYFLSKVNEDTAQKVITFMEGLKIGGDGKYGIDANGNAVLGDVVLDRVRDPHSTEADRTIIGAQGFDLYMGEDGKSHMYIDYLTTRVKMFAASAEVRKVSYSGGTTIFSNAGSTIVKVAYIFDASGSKVIAYKCYAAADDGTTKTMNWWHVGMMALCQTFNVKAGETENLANRYYWRMVVGVGQETLEDGKLYDYVMLSNMATFVGGDNVIPSYCSKLIAKKKVALKWGNIAVMVAQQDGMMSIASLFAEQEGGRTQDDDKNEIASRVFYGYNEGSVAPVAGDVIVNVGDQIRWNSRGNVIKLTTSTEDNSSDTAPSITMYHGIGALWETGKEDAKKQPVRNPYQWKTVTCVISPELTMFNTERFKWFSGTPDNLIDPITVMWEIVPTSSSIVRHVANRTTTPTDITFTLVKHIGSKAETIAAENVVFKATIEYQNGNKLNNAPFVNLASLASLYDMKSVKVDAYLKEEIKGADGQTETKQTLVKTTNVIVTSDGKEGSSGRGIVSVNTFYALGDNPLTSPVNTEYKYDTLSAVVINTNADKYVWSADKVTYSNNTTEFTGKYCVGKCADLTSVTEMWGISNSATVKPSVWSDTYPNESKLTPGTYIWSRDEIVWLDGTKTYSEAQLVGYIGTNGNNGRGIDSVNTFYALSDNITTSPVDAEYKYDTLSTVVIKNNADKYVWSADKVTYSNKTVELTGKYCVGKCADLTSVTEMYGVSNSATVIPKVWIYSYPTTEQLTPGSYIWSRDEIVWLDGTKEYSEAQLVGYVGKDGDKGEPGNPGDPGKPGKPGTDGQDAIQVDFLPTALTVEANSDSSGNAVVDCSSGNITAEILVRSGSKSVMSACDKIEIASVDGCTAEVVRTDTTTAKVRINSVNYTTIDDKRISWTTASVTVRVHCLLTNLYYSATLAINVNVAALWGEYKRDMKSMESKYTEISNATNKRVDDLGNTVDDIDDKVTDIDKALDGIPIKTDTDLTKYTSKIEQSARNISLKVGETIVGRHNLLTGSAFEKKTDYWTGNDAYMPYISVLNNYNGYNSVVIEGKSGSNRGVDFIRVKVKEARKYVVSAMLKCSGAVSEGDFNAYIVQRDGSMADLNKNLFIPFKVAKNMIANEWMLAAETLTLDANTAYIDCVFLYYGTKTAYIACPQIAEGEEYAGYTLSEQDRGYIGGNLLINTDTLVEPDTLSIYNSDPLVVDSTHTSLLQEGDANKYGSYATLYTDATSAEVNTIRWNLKGMNLIKQGQMYMLSFVAKGTGKVCAFLYNDGTPLVSTEASGFTSSNQSADGNALITLTSSWQRYFVFWRIVGDKLPIYVLFRAMKSSKLYLSQPKLEYGATVTEYRAEKTGYVEDKSIAGSLLDAGIDITSRQIMLTADKTMFRTTKGINVAVFDESGINAQLVRAQRLQTKGKNGAEVRIEDGMVQIFGAAGVANIRFGLDDNGYATLGYYDNHGNLLYDLGPKGIVKLDVSDSTMTRTAFIDIDAAGLVSPYTEKKDGYLWITADNNNKFFGLQGKPNVYVRVNLGVSKSVELYLYHAPRVNGEIMADEKYGMTKTQTEKADGCYFTSSQIQVLGSNFVNLAKGTYLPWDAQTRDNTKFRPIGVKSVPKLSIGGYMTLGTSALASTSQLKVLSTVYGGGVYVFPDDGFGNVEID